MVPKQLPTTYQDTIHVITTEYATLSKRLKQIAAYAVDNPNEFAINTIAEIARNANVQPSALVRFAKAFGFGGFSELQKIFQKRLLERTSSYETRLKGVTNSKIKTPHALLNQFAKANIIALQHLQQEISPAKLDHAIQLIDKAQTIYVFAMRRAFPLAAYLYYLFASMGRHAQLIDNTGGLYVQQAMHISKRDVLVVASFADYTPYVTQAAAEAHAKGIPVVAITDHQLSLLTHASTVCFHIEEAAVHDFRSLNATMCLAQSLVVGLGIKPQTCRGETSN